MWHFDTKFSLYGKMLQKKKVVLLLLRNYGNAYIIQPTKGQYKLVTKEPLQ